MVLFEVNQEVGESDSIKMSSPFSDPERVEDLEEDENLSDTDSEDEWDKPSRV